MNLPKKMISEKDLEILDRDINYLADGKDHLNKKSYKTGR